MLRRPLLHALLVGLLAAAPPASGQRPQALELERLIEDLGATDVGSRERAQRELAGRLVVLDGGAALVPLLEGVTPGVRRRLALLLGADDRLLRHAVELAVAGTAEVREVGRQAIDGQLLRWSRSAFDEPAVAAFDVPRQPTRFPDAWQDRTEVRVAVDPNTGGGVAAFERLDLFGGGPAPVIVDPQVVERLIRRPSPALDSSRLEGSWGEVLEGLASVHDCGFQVQGYRYPEDERREEGAVPARAWIHVVGRGSTERAPAGRDLRQLGGGVIERWCVDVAREGNIVRQSAAARALAALDWAAAVLWFEDRWQVTGDVVALEGLMAAAARGRVAPSLQRADSVRAILAFVDREAREVAAMGRAVEAAEDPEVAAVAREAHGLARAALDRRTARVAAGLAALAPITAAGRVSPAGRSLVPLFTDAFEASTPTGRWVRLVALEGLGVADAEGARLAGRVLGGELDARSRRQALRSLLVLRPLSSPRELELRDPDLLLRESATGEVAGLGLELGLAGARPPEGWTPADGASRGTPPAVGEPSDGWDAGRLSELLVWAALVAEQDGASGPCPGWMPEVVRAVLRAEEEARRFDLPGPLSLAAASVRADLVRAFGALAGWVRAELTPAEEAALLRVSLRAGLAGSGEMRVALDEALRSLEERRDEPGPVEDAWLDLAAMVGDPEVGDLALEALQGSLIEALERRSSGPAGSTRALRQATEAACLSLDRARRDDLSERFSGELRRVATMGSHPLADLFLDDGWPPAPPLPPRDLERLSAPLPMLGDRNR